MSCGLGAAVLLFLIIDHNLTELAQASETGEADVQVLEQEVQEQEDLIAEHRRQTQQLRRELQALTQERVAVIKKRAEIQAAQPSVGDTQRLQEEVREQQKKLQEAKKSQQLLKLQGEGQRQYLAGFRMEGERILILVDRSASMMHERIATIIRNKFLSVQQQIQSFKWRWTLSIFEWMLAHLPPDAQYQVWGFDVTTSSVSSRWLPASDTKRMQQVIKEVRGWVPSGGTRIDRPFEQIESMRPRPDAIYIITDGLPTQGRPKFLKKIFKSSTVSPETRMEFFKDATENITSPPFNIVLLPLEGDPFAAGAYWRLAMQTRGQFLAPSEEWP